MPKRGTDKKIGPQSARGFSPKSSRDREIRLEADRNYGRNKFITNIPEKALRQTF